MNTFERIGFIGRMVAVIGFTVALSACGDDTSSAGSTTASTTATAIGNVVSGSTTGSSAASTVSTSTTSSTSSTSTISSSSTSAGSPSGSTSSTPTVEQQSVTLAWTPPTENTDGTALTNLAGYTIYYGTSASALTQKIVVNSVGLSDYVVDNLTSGTWYFEVVAISASGVPSGPSGVVSVTI